MKHAQKEIILEKMHDTTIISWTYKRMTQAEKETVRALVDWIADCGPLDNMTTEKGIQALFYTMYHSFLSGIGYTGANWREPKKENNNQ